MNRQARFIVMTTVQVKQGHLERVAELFAQTNPALIEEEPDWLEAVFTANPETSKVVVMAFWVSAQSYEAFSSSAAFRDTMKQFSPHLAEAPEVRINNILVSMTRTDLRRFDSAR